MPDLILILPLLLFSVIVHEIAHGYVALRCGDPTARDAGRLTLNPLPHLDPFMTVILPLLLIVSRSGFILGGAKPVPVNPYLLRGGERDHLKVSSAGPASNLALAAAGFLLSLPSVLLWKITGSPLARSLVDFFNLFIMLNLVLANFNLLPLPPLDGSWILAYFLKGRLKAAYLGMRRHGFLVLILFLILASRIHAGSGDLFNLLFYPTLKVMRLLVGFQFHLLQ